MIDLDTAKHSIEQWMENFVEVPNPALGGWSPCPYARKARLERDFEIRIGTALLEDLVSLSEQGLNGKSVVIYVYDPAEYEYQRFHMEMKYANIKYLLKHDIIALEDHPSDPEIVNGVSMNQGTYALAMCQSISDLNEKAQHMASKGFYDSWPAEYLAVLFEHRQDPRQ